MHGVYIVAEGLDAMQWQPQARLCDWHGAE